MGLRHRGDVKGGCYFITTSVAGFVQVFNIPECANIVINSLNYCANKYGANLNAYVLMPHHIHCIIRIPETVEISNFMRDFKKFTSVQIKHFLENASEHKALIEALCNYVPNLPNRFFKLWQDRFDDLELHNEQTFRTKLNYLYNNPVKAGLVEKAEDYPYLFINENIN